MQCTLHTVFSLTLTKTQKARSGDRTRSQLNRSQTIYHCTTWAWKKSRVYDTLANQDAPQNSTFLGLDDVPSSKCFWRVDVSASWRGGVGGIWRLGVMALTTKLERERTWRWLANRYWWLMMRNERRDGRNGHVGTQHGEMDMGALARGCWRRWLFWWADLRKFSAIS